MSDHITESQEVPLRRCSRCKEKFPATTDYFYVNRSRPSGLHVSCKECEKKSSAPNREKRAQYYKKYREENRDKIREKNKRYNTANKDKIAAYQKKHYSDHPEKQVAKNKKYDKAKKAKYGHDYFLSHRAQKRAYAKEYEKKNREKRTKYVQKHRSENKEQAATYKQRRRARELSLPDTFSVSQWESALSWFSGCCAYCGRPPDFWQKIAMEHFVPLANAECPGTIVANILPACNGPDGCNTRKGAQDPVQWITRTFGKRKSDAILKRIHEYFEWAKRQ